jgi:hypothetical protein
MQHNILSDYLNTVEQAVLTITDAYIENYVFLVPTRCAGIHSDRAAVYSVARCYCIPTRRVGTSAGCLV